MRVWDWHVHSAKFKTDSQQGPTVQHREYIQYLVITYNGKQSKKELIYL